MTKANQKNNSGSAFKTIFFVLIISAAIAGYWYNTKDSTSDTYEIKSAGGEFYAKPSYINRTGKDVEEKKIKLSDSYWSSGKFSF